jgi:hypothetical protein
MCELIYDCLNMPCSVCKHEIQYCTCDHNTNDVVKPDTQQLKVDICQYCKGFGEILSSDFEDEYYMSAEQATCPYCKGTGKRSTI